MKHVQAHLAVEALEEAEEAEEAEAAEEAEEAEEAKIKRGVNELTISASNIYKKMEKYVYKIAIFTDATDFDHQPLLLVKNTILLQ